MYTLEEIKEVLGDDYAFKQTKTIEEVKKILETGEMADNNDVPFVLEAGNLDVEVFIYFDEGMPPFLGYYCCVREDGCWESYGDLEDRVNLDVPDLEAEMFRVLAKFAEEYSLSFFVQNENNTYDSHNNETEDEEDMEI